jgi:hypothetical protein
MLAALLFALAQTPATAGSTVAVTVPARFVAGRVLATPRTTDGHTLTLWVDTGGGGGSGMYLLTASAVDKLHLQTSRLTLGKQSARVATLPTYARGAGIPAPAGRYAKALVIKSLGSPADDTHYDGMLGAGYLPGNFRSHARIWTFDYPGHHLTLQRPHWQPSAEARSVPLHFPHDDEGRLGSGFPRFVVRVDGKPLSMLLDTGATGYPTAAARRVEGGHARVRATSFITTNQLERWHHQHPDWRVVNDADRMRIKGQSMRAIEVPSVTIAGWRVGPVWFTERPDTNFHDYMSSMMDAQVEGAIGGNALRHFVMTVDYHDFKGWFRCVSACDRPASDSPASSKL